MPSVLPSIARFGSPCLGLGHMIGLAGCGPLKTDTSSDVIYKIEVTGKKFIAVGETTEFTAKVINWASAEITGWTVHWSSSDPKVATVAGFTNTATVTGIGEGGPVTITAEAGPDQKRRAG